VFQAHGYPLLNWGKRSGELATARGREGARKGSEGGGSFLFGRGRSGGNTILPIQMQIERRGKLSVKQQVEEGTPLKRNKIKGSGVGKTTGGGRLSAGSSPKTFSNKKKSKKKQKA